MATILVTGVSGFVGSAVASTLLAAGHSVRGTVRSLAKVPEALGGMEAVEADLLDPGAFASAVMDVDAVVHTASPYVVDVKDPQRDLVDPAVKGTMNVLEACVRSPRLRRVVVTSSMAAVTDEPDPTRVYTEADWNITSSLTRNPYYYSKAEAERAAWRFVESAKVSWDLVTINPSLIVGPSLVAARNTSTGIITDLFKGAYPGILNLAWSFVDVRDVALAHLKALTAPAANGRYVCAGETIDMQRLVEILRRLEPTRKLPRRKLPDPIVRLASHLQSKGVGSYLRTNLGKVPRFDNSKIKSDLGVTFGPAEQSIADTVADLKKWGHLS